MTYTNINSNINNSNNRSLMNIRQQNANNNTQSVQNNTQKLINNNIQKLTNDATRSPYANHSESLDMSKVDRHTKRK